MDKIIGLEVTEVSFVTAGANEPSKIKLYKSKSGMDNIVKGAATCRMCGYSVKESDKFCHECGIQFWKSAPKEKTEMTAEEKAAADAAAAVVAKAAADAAAAEAETIAKAAKDAADKATADAAAAEAVAVEKADLVKQLEIAKAATAKAEGELAASKRIEKVRDAKDRVVAKMKSVPVAVDELSEKLVQLAEANPDLAEYFEGVISKANALAEQSLSQASNPAAPATTGSAEDKLNALVAKKRSETPELTKEKATVIVLNENKALYNEYNAEKASK